MLVHDASDVLLEVLNWAVLCNSREADREDKWVRVFPGLGRERERIGSPFNCIY